MSEINAAQRKRVAAQLAEADKIKMITAWSRSRKDRLHGVRIAQQRKAIVDGLAESITELKANVDMTEEQIMSHTLDQ